MTGYGLGARIRATLAPDFDSGSGHGSAFTDPGFGCLPESRTFLRNFWTFTDFYGLFLDLNCTLKRYARWRVERGKLRLKSGLKQEKLSVRPFKLRSSFTRVEGGSDRRMAHWGLLANRHQTSLINFNFNPRVCFLRLLFAWFVRAVVRKTDFKAVLKTQRFNRNKIRQFFTPV